jgi:hypothetical protein
MSYRGREKEIKLLYQGDMKLPALNYLLTCIFPVAKSIYATSTDTYWKLQDVPGQFIRARNLDGEGKWQITVKGVDKDSTRDRIEREVGVASSPIAMLRAAHGTPIGFITKTYYTHWLTGATWDNIACYTVKEGPQLGIVIEVESDTIERVLELAEIIKSALPVIEATGSLYDMLLKSKE